MLEEVEDKKIKVHTEPFALSEYARIGERLALSALWRPPGASEPRLHRLNCVVGYCGRTQHTRTVRGTYDVPAIDGLVLRGRLEGQSLYSGAACYYAVRGGEVVGIPEAEALLILPERDLIDYRAPTGE